LIRRAALADAAALTAVHRASRAAAYAHHGPPDIAAGVHVTLEHWREWVERAAVWVDERDGTILGFASVYEGTLTGLYVAPEAQGQGVGAGLLGVAVAHGARALWVHADSPRARAFYERHGWVAEPDSVYTDPDWLPAVPALRYRFEP
jgi:GNAT superfamily N-acetyltransferase